MKYLAILLVLMLFTQESISQTRLKDLPFSKELKIVHDDSVSRTICIDDKSNTYWVDSIYPLFYEYEYPEKGVITQRSFLVSGTNKYLLDSLIIKNYNDYCLSLDIARVNIFKQKGSEYLFIECYNIFQYGSDSQPIFILLTKEGKNFAHPSVYLMDIYSENAYENIYILYENDKIVMKGEGVSLISF